MQIGGITMMKKVITCILVLAILGASQATGFAYNRATSSLNFSRNGGQSAIEIISPRGSIILQDSLLISVHIFDNASATLNIYKVDTDELEDVLIFGPDKVDQGARLKIYTKELKDLSPGKYRMLFSIEDKLGEPMAPVIKYFTVKNGEPEMNRFLNSIPRTTVTNIIENIIGRIEN